MKVEVRPIHVKGRALFTSEREKLPPVVGELRVGEERKRTLGRVATTARLLSLSDPTPVDILPELSDARLLWLRDGRMRLRGDETVEGVAYVQAWDVRVLGC